MVLATGQAQQQDTIVVTSPTGCIPDTLSVTISVPTGAVTQTFLIDARCDGGRGLTLLGNYGAFESVGYTCDATDVHNCVQTVTYGNKVCNDGPEPQKIYEFDLTTKETNTAFDESCDLLQDGSIPMLGPGECYYENKPFEVNRCVQSNYCVDVVANATDVLTGIPPSCPASDEIKFGWPGMPLPPPTPFPTVMPSPPPSPAPTSACVIDVKIDGCPAPNISLDNNCEGRPQTITFKYTGGDCAQSRNFQSRQKFMCTPAEGPSAPTTKGTVNYIEAVPRGGGDLYFAGNVAVGDNYILNENKQFDKLSADMTITIFESQGGAVLQTVDVHLSCSQALFLFDKFGANQVVRWVETDGRVVEAQAFVTTDDFVLNLETSEVTGSGGPITLTEMSVLTNAQDLPIDYTPQVAGKQLIPGQPINLPGFQLDIDLTQRTEYTFFTTIIGQTSDGTPCNGSDFHSCVVGFNLSPSFPTDVPTPRPTITPFPTGSPNSTACEIASNIECTVTRPANPKLPLSCSDLSGSVSATCSSELLAAFLEYDGSLGPRVFVNPTCGKNEFFGQFVNANEVVELNTRAADFCDGAVTIGIYDADPLQGGSQLGSADVELSCPGPWTIGNTIAPGLTLAYYVSTVNNGLTFTYNFLDAEVQIDYVGINAGAGPLTVSGGDYSGTSPFTSGAITGGSTITGRGRQVLATETQTISLPGTGGTALDFSMSVDGATANQFALPCTTASNYRLNL